jgi:hypothetical protein
VQRSSFKRAANTVVVAALCVLLLQVDAGADEPGPVGQAAETTVVETTLAEPTQAPPPTTAPPPTEPPTTAPPPTEPPTTAPPPTEPPTTAPPTTEPPTTAPPTTEPPTASGPLIGPNTMPPAAPPPSSGSPSTPGAAAAIGAGVTAIGEGATAAFKSAVQTIGSTATTAARRLVPTMRKLARIPAVRKLTESQPVAATKQAVMFVTEELRELNPSKVAPFLWLALLALLVSCGAFLRLWWAPADWPSARSLAVGAHRRAGQSPRRAWLGWPATAPPRRSRRRSGWQPSLPAASELTTPSRPRRIGIDVGRLRSLPPAGKPIFTGDDLDLD